MKILFFVSYTSSVLYCAYRWDCVAYVVVFLLTFGAVFLVLYSLYRHLAAHFLL